MLRGTFSRPEKASAAVTDDRLIIIGVRHHSPACANLVRSVIRRAKPAFVLIEGPADFNSHLGDLSLDHKLPLAIFSYYATANRSFASYSPFCAYSPEWEAIKSAADTGATALFCDLPAWHPDFGERANRYADPRGQHAAAAEQAACLALGEEGRDALWDALAEQAEPDELAARLDHYFDLLRPDGAEDLHEDGRERFMAAYAAWALRQTGSRKIVLVCGGWHAAAIRQLVHEADGQRPQLPSLSEEERAGSYLVPYDYRRLDRFAGYASGMPSPAYYEEVHSRGLPAAADWAEEAIVHAMRTAGQVLSTADRIAWRTHSQALSRARGHRSVLRSDLLDAALATLVKEGLDEPAAWTHGGKIRPGTHPALVAMLNALTGIRSGKLAPGTREPPLVSDIESRLAKAGLTPEIRARKITLDWSDDADRDKARLLNALRILGIPIVERLDGPRQPSSAAPRETFRLADHPDAQGVMIEASRWGGTLPMAANALLAQKTSEAAGDLKMLTICLAESLFSGLLSAESALTAELASGIASVHDIGGLGASGRLLVQLYRFGGIFGPTAHAALGDLCTALFAKVLLLTESIQNEEEGLRAIAAMIACRDILRECPDLSVERGPYIAMLGRVLADAQTAPAIAGAALGTLAACGEGQLPDAQQYLRHFSRPDQLGDFLQGLFGLAREEIIRDQHVIDAVQRLVKSWDDIAFLQALPALRQAFGFFPPREKENLARLILRAHGSSEVQADLQAWQWMRQRENPLDQAAALQLEALVAKRLGDVGLM
ncbi:hypothetical protein FS764_06690 [Agrobacterium vitis]|nr:hypothetical protein [Agrobacterium vitis]